jgi:hypothetical protein
MVRGRVLIAALLLGAVAACERSEPAANTADDDVRANTVLPSGTEAETPIASAVETHTQPEAPVQPAAVQTRARPAMTTALPAPAPADASHAGHAPAAELTAAPAPEAEAAPTTAAGSGSGKTRPALNEGPVPDPYPGRDGVIIIRGGTARIDDDCALHPRVGGVDMIGSGGILTGAGGALINDLLPPGGALINDRGPAAPPVGADPVSRGGTTVLNSPDPRRGSGVQAAGPSRRAPAATRGGGMPRRGGIR